MLETTGVFPQTNALFACDNGSFTSGNKLNRVYEL